MLHVHICCQYIIYSIFIISPYGNYYFYIQLEDVAGAAQSNTPQIDDRWLVKISHFLNFGQAELEPEVGHDARLSRILFYCGIKVDDRGVITELIDGSWADRSVQLRIGMTLKRDEDNFRAITFIRQAPPIPRHGFHHFSEVPVRTYTDEEDIFLKFLYDLVPRLTPYTSLLRFRVCYILPILLNSIYLNMIMNVYCLGNDNH
jgi:hypothetical protein